MELSEDCFFQMTRMLVDAAERHCNGRVISSLEGGYNLRALGRTPLFPFGHGLSYTRFRYGPLSGRRRAGRSPA